MKTTRKPKPRKVGQFVPLLTSKKALNFAAMHGKAFAERMNQIYADAYTPRPIVFTRKTNPRWKTPLKFTAKPMSKKKASLIDSKSGCWLDGFLPITTDIVHILKLPDGAKIEPLPDYIKEPKGGWRKSTVRFFTTGKKGIEGHFANIGPITGIRRTAVSP